MTLKEGNIVGTQIAGPLSYSHRSNSHNSLLETKLFSFHTCDMLICKSVQSPDMKTGNVVKSVCVVPHVSLLSLHSSHTQAALLLDGLQLICANGLCD